MVELRGIRTADLLHAMQALSQLSYNPTKVGLGDKHRTALGIQYNNQESGGATRDSTADLLHAMQALSQLSYNPFDSRLFEENLVELRGIRTADLLHAMQALSQLSYNPNSPRR